MAGRTPDQVRAELEKATRELKLLERDYEEQRAKLQRQIELLERQLPTAERSALRRSAQKSGKAS